MNKDTVIDYRVLGRNLKAARKRLAKTQKDVAKELGIIVSTYGKFQRGTLRPSLERLVAICILLKISVEDSLRGAVGAEMLSSNAFTIEDNYLLEFKDLIEHCHHPDSVPIMLTICHQVASITN